MAVKTLLDESGKSLAEVEMLGWAVNDVLRCVLAVGVSTWPNDFSNKTAMGRKTRENTSGHRNCVDLEVAWTWTTKKERDVDRTTRRRGSKRSKTIFHSHSVTCLFIPATLKSYVLPRT